MRRLRYASVRSVAITASIIAVIGARDRLCVISHAATSDLSLGLRTLDGVQEQLEARNFSAILIPHSDAHASEYLRECDERVRAVTGFRGSNAFAMIYQNGSHARGALYTDGRYFEQASKELWPGWTLMKAGLPSTPSSPDFLVSQLKGKLDISSCDGGEVCAHRVAFPAEIFSQKKFHEFEKKLKTVNACLTPIDLKDFDELILLSKPWPACVVTDVVPFTVGEDVGVKLARVAKAMAEADSTELLVSDLADIAWLLNVRGNDVPMNRVFFSYLHVSLGKSKRVTIYSQKSEELKTLLGPKVAFEDATGSASAFDFEYKPYEEAMEGVATDLYDRIKAREKEGGKGGGKTREGGVRCSVGKALRVLVDERLNQAFASRLEKLSKAKGGDELLNFVPGPSLVGKLRMVKSEGEINAARRVYRRDSLALSVLLAWLHHWSLTNPAQNFDGKFSECDVSRVLEELRRSLGDFVEPSFSTISAFADNGAIIHYDPHCPTVGATGTNYGTDGNGPAEQVLLLDSGGHYDDATTDVTRVVSLMGDRRRPSDKLVRDYTLVLQAYTELASLIFPNGTSSVALDAVARQPLWRHRRDYGHGTGHSIAPSLQVHEAPPSLGKAAASATPIVQNMMFSVEPGLYRPEKYGIRLENIVVTLPHSKRLDDDDDDENDEGGGSWLQLKPLTFVPFERSLIDRKRLSPDQVETVNAYHAVTRRVLGRCLERDVPEPFLKMKRELLPDDIWDTWLEMYTAPLE